MYKSLLCLTVLRVVVDPPVYMEPSTSTAKVAPPSVVKPSKGSIPLSDGKYGIGRVTTRGELPQGLSFLCQVRNGEVVYPAEGNTLYDFCSEYVLRSRDWSLNNFDYGYYVARMDDATDDTKQESQRSFFSGLVDYFLTRRIRE